MKTDVISSMVTDIFKAYSESYVSWGEPIVGYFQFSIAYCFQAMLYISV